MQQHIQDLEKDNNTIRQNLTQVENHHQYAMDQLVMQMAIIMDALLTLTKEETQEFAKGMLASGLI